MTALLAVDVGNTNTVLGVFRDGELVAHWRIQTIAQRTSDEYAVLLKTLLDLDGFPWKTINAGIIFSGVPASSSRATRSSRCRRVSSTGTRGWSTRSSSASAPRSTIPRAASPPAA